MINVDIINFQSEMSRYIKYVTDFNQPININTGSEDVVLINKQTYNEIEEILDYAGEMSLEAVFGDYSSKIRKTTWNDIIEYFMDLPYKTNVIYNESTECYVASNPELDGCVASAEYENAAISLLRDFRRFWVTDRLRKCMPMPKNEAAINEVIAEKQKADLPITRYDEETKRAYLEYKGGRRVYMDEPSPQLSSDEVDIWFRLATWMVIYKKSSKAGLIARYDKERNKPYFEYPDGRREYLDGQNDNNK